MVWACDRNTNSLGARPIHQFVAKSTLYIACWDIANELAAGIAQWYVLYFTALVIN